MLKIQVAVNETIQDFPDVMPGMAASLTDYSTGERTVILMCCAPSDEGSGVFRADAKSEITFAHLRGLTVDRDTDALLTVTPGQHASLPIQLREGPATLLFEHVRDG